MRISTEQNIVFNDYVSVQIFLSRSSSVYLIGLIK